MTRNIALWLALLLASLALPPAVARAAEWSGIRVYVGHPQEAWSGSSACEPCNRFCADLRAYNRRLKELGGNGWRVGYTEAGSSGQPNRIVVLRALDGEATPSFVGVLDGVETTARITGYNPDDPARTLDAVLQLDPIGTRLIPPQPSRAAPRTLSDNEPAKPRPVVVRETIREVVTAPPRVAPAARRTTPRAQAYHPHWTWPGDLKEHLHQTHGYPRAWLDRLTRDELESLHDGDHDSGRVTPAGVQRWPASTARRTRSQGVELLGLPLYQQWSTRSACPGGVCPR